MIKASFIVRNAKNEIIFGIPIKAKTTMIINDSGEGKTRFVEFLRDGKELFGFKLSIDFEYPFKVSKSVKFIHSELLDSDPQDMIDNTKDPYILFLVDEASQISTKLIRRLYDYNNPVLVLGRPSGFNEKTGLESIYEIEWLGGQGEESKFELKPHMILPKPEETDEFDFILTEAAKNKSECQLLKRYYDNSKIIPMCGQSRLLKGLRIAKSEKLLLFLDQGNVSDILSILPRLLEHKTIKFYPYTSFEEYLFRCDKLKNFMHPDSVISGLHKNKIDSLKAENVRENKIKEDPFNQFNFPTLERFYENLLKEKTQGTEFAYDHDSSPILSEAYFEKIGFDLITDDLKDILKSFEKPETENPESECSTDSETDFFK